MTDVLLVEDDPLLREATQLSLERYGYQVRAVSDGQAGLAEFRDRVPDVAVLDVMLPRLDGVALVRLIRAESRLPVLMVSARTDPVDVVVGLEAGADDYVVKPAGAELLEARIRAVLRRVAPAQEGGTPTTASAGPERHADLTVDRTTLVVAKHGAELPLAPSELKLLLHLAAAPEQVFSRQQLLEHVWEHSFHADARLVDACVARLRGKIEDTDGSPRYVQTLRGFGYRFGPL